MVRVRAMRTLENAMRRWGFYRVAGCDEVGRGCLAGPVVAGAVILDPDALHSAPRDSKMITALERERLYDLITRKALAWSVAAVAAGGNRRAQHPPRLARGDAPRGHGDRAAARHGPRRRVPHSRPADRAARRAAGRPPVPAIAAASIVAKVTRDREMLVAPRQRSALRLRAAQGLRDRRPPGRRCPLRLLAAAPPLVQAADQPV